MTAAQHNHPSGIYCGDRACPAFVFKPAFDMPTTPAEAIAVLRVWGDARNLTFSADRAARCAIILDGLEARRGLLELSQSALLTEVSRLKRLAKSRLTRIRILTKGDPGNRQYSGRR